MREILALTAGTIVTSDPPRLQRQPSWNTLTHKQAKDRRKRREQRRQAQRSQRRNRL